MIRHGDPTCAGCGKRPDRGMFCRTCWGAIGSTHRREIEQAWKAYLAKPGSLTRRHEYDVAVSAAAGAIA